jgi:hypothetical protein
MQIFQGHLVHVAAIPTKGVCTDFSATKVTGVTSELISI